MAETKFTTPRRNLLAVTICMLLVLFVGLSLMNSVRGGQENQNSNRKPKNSNKRLDKDRAPSLPPSRPGNTNANKPIN